MHRTTFFDKLGQFSVPDDIENLNQSILLSCHQRLKLTKIAIPFLFPKSICLLNYRFFKQLLRQNMVPLYIHLISSICLKIKKTNPSHIQGGGKYNLWCMFDKTEENDFLKSWHDINKGSQGIGEAIKTDEFSEKFQRGWGALSIQKFDITDFGPLKRAFWAWHRPSLRMSYARHNHLTQNLEIIWSDTDPEMRFPEAREIIQSESMKRNTYS